MADFRKLKNNLPNSELNELPIIVKLYTESGISIRSKVFKFYEQDGFSYYSYYSSGRYYTPIIGKSSDGENFTYVNISEIDSMNVPYMFDEILFLKDFEVTEIDIDKLEILDK